MNNIRDKFEAWNIPKPESFYADKNTYDLMLDAWQAATEQSQKEIAEKDARIAELERNVEKLTNANETWLEWRDEQVKQLDVLQAREKVLVEALEHYEPVISAIDNSKGFVARQAIANVRGE